MENVPEAKGRSLRRRRRARWIAALVLLLVGLAIAALQIARVAAERTLSAALGTPVTIGTVWWLPWNGRLTANRVTIGSGDDQITARRVAALINPFRVSRDDVIISHVDIDAPAGPIEIDDQYGIRIGALGGAARGAGGSPPHVGIGELVVRDGEIAVRYPVGGATRTMPVRVTQFRASGVDLSPSPDGVRIKATGQFEGAMDRAPVHGDVQLLLAGEDTSITGSLAISGLPVNRDVVPLPPALETLTATLDVQATLDVTGKPMRPMVRADVRIAEPRWTGEDGSELSAKHVSLEKVQIDLRDTAIELGPVAVDEPTVVVAVTDAGVVLPIPKPQPPAGPRPTWKISSGAIDLRRGTVRLQRDATTLALQLESAHWDGLQPGHSSKLAATLRADAGTIRVDGTLAANPPAAQLTARLNQVALPPFSAFLPGSPVALSRGTLSGEVRVVARDRLERIEGELHVDNVHTAPPDPGFPSEVMAIHAADIELTVSMQPKLAIDVASLKLSYPYVMVQRRRAGTFPYLLLGGDDTAAASASSSHLPDVRIRHVAADGGRVEFVDATMTPPYWTILTDTTAEAHDVRLPERTVGYFKISGKQDELSPALVSGSFSEHGLDARIEISDVLLESMNAYVAPILGYRMISGRLSVTATAMPVPPLLQSHAEVVLEDVGVSQTGTDLVREQSGVPLPIALSLIADAAGEIRLTLPITVDPAARSVSLGSVLWQAIRSAIVGALSTPLRLLGSLFGTEGAPHAFAVDPIPFPIGSAALDVHGRARVEQIARILQAHATLALVTLPQLTPEDLRETGPDGAAALAAARADAVRQALSGAAAAPHIAPERLLPATWTPATGAEPTGKPGVYIELQEGAWTRAAAP